MLSHRLRRKFEPWISRGFHFYWRFARATTLGAFGMVIDHDGRIFLIKHSYVAGWHFPGGGVEPGESLRTGLARELSEEGNIQLTGEPLLHGMYHNPRVSRRDHVALFIVRDFVQPSPPVPDREIVDHGFFALDALPDDTGRAARARIAEVFEGVKVSEVW